MSAIVNTSFRLGVIALSCVGLAGCGIGGAVGILVGDIASGKFPPPDWQLARAEEGLCSEVTGRGITVTKLLATPIPANEGEARMFEPAFWRPEVKGESYPEFNRWSKAAEGMLATTDRSVFFVPLGGVAGVRIPYELVTSVEIQQGSFTSASPAIIVKSLCGRIDTFTLAQLPSSINLDPEATIAAAAHLKARVAAFQATDAPH